MQTLVSSSAFLTVQGPYSPNVYNNGMLNVGTMRYNPGSARVEVYDGSAWQILELSSTIGLSWDADNAIRWAIDKMREEQEIKNLAMSNESVKIALDNVKKAEEQLKTTIILSRETNDQPTT